LPNQDSRKCHQQDPMVVDGSMRAEASRVVRFAE
jgi:hypothetical protein